MTVGDAALRQELALPVSGGNGALHVSGAVIYVDTIAELQSLDTSELVDGQAVRVTSPGRAGDFVWSSDNLSMEVSVDRQQGVWIAPQGGDGSTGAWVRQYSGSVNVEWFGAVNADDSQAAADTNREAFRGALFSYKADWDAYKVKYEKGRDVYVPPGDWTISNGIAIPQGTSLKSSGTGTARIKCLSSIEDTQNPKLPLVSMGCVITDLGALERTTGGYVIQPPSEIDKLYLNPQNSNTALYVDAAGYKVGSLWIQALVGVHIDNGSSDGVFESLMIEQGSGQGVALGDCQNVTIKSLYSFVTNSPVYFRGDSNNINIINMQANYTRNFVIGGDSSATVRGFSVDNLVCNQNIQYPTFYACVFLQQALSDVYIGRMDARNYNGRAIDITASNNTLRIGSLKLRQSPFNPSYTTGNEAAGCYVRDGSLLISSADIQQTATAPLIMLGSSPSVSLLGGVVASFTGNEILNISSTGGFARLDNFINNSLKPLFNPVTNVAPKWKGVANPFPVITEGGRTAIKIPYCNRAGSWNIGIVANVNTVAGGGNYRRTRKLWATVENGYDATTITRASAISLGNTGLSTGFTPDIDYQIDLDNVGDGNQKPVKTSGNVVISVPSSYGSVVFHIEPDVLT